MRSLIFLFIIIPFSLHAQVLEINWTSGFRKEINVTCEANDLFCETLCNASSQCIVPEGPCRDCIGTSIKMNHLITEIGNTITNKGLVANKSRAIEALKSNRFITLTAQDVYNVIDAARSVKTFKKFEKLCPEESVNQILFLSVNSTSREIKRPEFVYCDFYDRTEFYEISSDVIVDVHMRLHNSF